MLLQVVVLVLLPLSSILLVDSIVFVLTKGPHIYAYAKLIVEAGIEEVKRLKEIGDKRSERKLRKLKHSLDEIRSRFMRIHLYRFLMLLAMYVLTVAMAYRNYTFSLKVNLCIPFITYEYQGMCYTIPVIVIILAYLMWLPFVEEPLLVLSVYRRLLRSHSSPG